MSHSVLFRAVIVVAGALASFPIARGQEPAMIEAVRQYVNEPDSAYEWNVTRHVKTGRTMVYTVRLTSQTWRTEKDVDQPVWEHWLLVVKPEDVAFDTGFLMVGGGSNNNAGPPSGPKDITLRIARATNSVVAELKMVPNQPIAFQGDGVPRHEDDLIGYAWNQFLESGDVTWLPRLPMVKSAVRAMDCVQELMASEVGGELAVENFVVAGASKRGWTTWMTAAVDRRVEAIIPIVIDVLNVDPSIRHHAAVYGFWADALGDYVHHGITGRWSEPRMKELYAVVDPYLHRERLKMPKFIVNACGDQFFCPDSSQFYFSDLLGEKVLRYVPNADHSLDGSDAVESVVAFYLSVLKDQPRPRFKWTFEPDGAIRVKTAERPQRVLLWHATNPAARDFRMKTIGAAFSSRELTGQGDGVYVAEMDAPKQGWTAYLVELTYDVGAPVPLKLTTSVRVIPNTRPHAGIDPAQVPYEGDL